MPIATFSDSDFWRTLGEVRRNFDLDLGLTVAAVSDTFADKKILGISQVYFS
jgi:hypothetical protein